MSSITQFRPRQIISPSPSPLRPVPKVRRPAPSPSLPDEQEEQAAWVAAANLMAASELLDQASRLIVDMLGDGEVLSAAGALDAILYEDEVAGSQTKGIKAVLMDAVVAVHFAVKPNESGGTGPEGYGMVMPSPFDYMPRTATISKEQTNANATR